MKRRLAALPLCAAVFVPAAAAAAPILAPGPAADPAAYQVSEIASGLDHPWSLALLPDGAMLVTERNGGLRLIRDGRLAEAPVGGLPEAYKQGQGGYFDVVTDPAFAANGLVYVAYAEGTDEANRTAIARGRFDGSALQDVTVIFRNVPDKDTGAHFGGRLAFLADGTLLLTTGDGFQYREQAQDKASGLGKIVRLAADGSIPADNPFAAESGARPEVWSYGHRNQQGLAVDPATGTVYQTEHGALSGDEVNVIVKGANYGWPIATYSVDYSGSVISPYTDVEGTVQPLAVWMPERFAPSGLAVYRGALFPEWDGDLLAGGLAAAQVARLDLDAEGKVVGETRLFAELGERIRDVRVGPDGAIYLLTDEDNGKVLKVTPK
ncbi:MAG: PQQ-dependent sugar dehydrogenase [Alphaproteobacteria bacterium]|nr:PQQ-dependent sugar dehydrogenase [Alphaproteobacteria bacterium]